MVGVTGRVGVVVVAERRVAQANGHHCLLAHVPGQSPRRWGRGERGDGCSMGSGMVVLAVGRLRSPC